MFGRLFAVLLERGFIAMIGSKASVAGGVRIQYLGESIDGESASVATTLLTRSGQELPVDYWMVRRGDRWKMQDVVVDGVSLVMIAQSSYGSFAAGLRDMGSWQLEAERSPLPNLLHVTVKLTE